MSLCRVPGKDPREVQLEVESAFWEWERLETLKDHYQALRER